MAKESPAPKEEWIAIVEEIYDMEKLSTVPHHNKTQLAFTNVMFTNLLM